MLLRNSLLLILLFFSGLLSAQNYFQQNVNTIIKVELNDQTNTLFGDIKINYKNNSEDTLHFIYIHLWPNAYKNNNTAFAKQQVKQEYFDFYFSTEEQRGFIDSLSFTVNGKPTICSYNSVNKDISKLMLSKPLFPRDSVFIETPFFIKIPSNFSRLAHDNHSYYISQWFPKPAVYDNNGWNEMPYLDMGEFYSEFGNYKVTITAPKKYTIAATGNKIKDTTINNKTSVTYTESNIHDFAWFAIKNPIIKEDSIIFSSGKKVIIQSIYPEHLAAEWENSTSYVKNTLIYFSKWYFEYPYKTCKIVYGDIDGGMEYPTISLIGSSYSEQELESVIVHEVGHNWFYGILGFNERKSAWLDEGLNTFSEIRFMIEESNNMKPDYNNLTKILGWDKISYKDYYLNDYINLARKKDDLPPNSQNSAFDEENYYTMMYNKSALSFYLAYKYLGSQNFDSIMQMFFNEYKFKHPTNENLKTHFQKHSPKPILWVFNQQIEQALYSDYKIKNLKKESFIIKNKGTASLPFPIHYYTNNGDTILKWQKGFAGKKTIKINDFSLKKIVIDPDKLTLDINQHNNSINNNFLETRESIKIQIGNMFEIPDQKTINVLPLFLWNEYDHWMPGISSYSPLQSYQNFQYYASIFFGTHSHQVLSKSFARYQIYPSNTIIKKLTTSVNYQRFSLISTLNPYQSFHFSEQIALRSAQNKSNKINIDFFYNQIPLDYINSDTDFKSLGKLSYQYNLTKPLQAFSTNTCFEGNENFVKANIVLNYKYLYKKGVDGFNLRIFAGTFLYETNTYYGNYNFYLSGKTGIQDYTYSTLFLGRSETYSGDYSLLSRQFIKTDGGFTTFSYLGQTNKWMISANTSFALPFILPIKPYVNAAIFDRTGLSGFKDILYWESGIEIFIIPQVFQIYLPIFMSQE